MAGDDEPLAHPGSDLAGDDEHDEHDVAGEPVEVAFPESQDSNLVAFEIGGQAINVSQDDLRRNKTQALRASAVTRLESQP